MMNLKKVEEAEEAEVVEEEDTEKIEVTDLLMSIEEVIRGQEKQEMIYCIMEQKIFLLFEN